MQIIQTFINKGICKWSQTCGWSQTAALPGMPTRTVWGSSPSSWATVIHQNLLMFMDASKTKRFLSEYFILTARRWRKGMWQKLGLNWKCQEKQHGGINFERFTDDFNTWSCLTLWYFKYPAPLVPPRWKSARFGTRSADRWKEDFQIRVRIGCCNTIEAAFFLKKETLGFEADVSQMFRSCSEIRSLICFVVWKSHHESWMTPP